MGFDKIQCNGVYLFGIIKEGHAALSVNLYPGYIFNPIPMVQGIGIQEGSVLEAQSISQLVDARQLNVPT